MLFNKDSAFLFKVHSGFYSCYVPNLIVTLLVFCCCGFHVFFYPVVVVGFFGGFWSLLTSMFFSPSHFRAGQKVYPEKKLSKGEK